MKTILMSLITLVALSVHATSPEPRLVPKVSCELMYSKLNDQGYTDTFARGENVNVSTTGAKWENSGFAVKAQLRQICAADGGPCSDVYTLTADIQKGDSAASISVEAKNSDKDKRYSSGLTVGKENGYLNCVVNSFYL